jgi:SAM-dependent methyltransferase
MARVTGSLAADYSTAGRAWVRGPARIYDELARILVEQAATDWTGRLVLDVGSGTGAAARAVAEAGGLPVATDLAAGMLAANPDRGPRVVADALELPIGDDSVHGYVAAFSLNHLQEPARALAEATRVVRRGGPILVSSYAADDGHPAKGATEQAARELGWSPPDWAGELRTARTPLLATPDRMLTVGRAAGLRSARARRVEVRFPDLTPRQLVGWRLGMAQLAPFVQTLGPADRTTLERRAVDLLGAPPVLVRPMLVLEATA